MPLSGSPLMASNPKAHRLIVVLRQSPNWDMLAKGEAVHDTAEFDQMQRRPIGTTARLIEIWNLDVPLHFYHVRQKMKEIAENACRQLRGADIISVDQFVEPFDEEALYVFTDDDDWFAPEIAECLLSSAATTADAAVWVSSVFERGTLYTRPNSKAFCYTNNYALHGSFMARVPRKSGSSLQQITQHGWAEGMVHGARVDLLVLSHHLSITNKHPCAFTVLESTLSNNKRIADLISPYRNSVRVSDDLFHNDCSDLKWASPYIEEVSQFLVATTQI